MLDAVNGFTAAALTKQEGLSHTAGLLTYQSIMLRRMEGRSGQ
jgi:hypothetical protein